MIKNKQQALQVGFSLIEVMVGLAIGLIATLVVMQTFSTFEGRKRTTTGTSDAQVNGNIAIYNLQREIQFAGYGFALADGPLPDVTRKVNEAAAAVMPTYTAIAADNFSALRCNASGAPLKVDHDNLPGTADIDFVPVQIVDGGAGLSDTLMVNYGDTDFGGLPRNVVGATGNSISINPAGCRNDDLVLVMRSTNVDNCMVTRVTSTDAQLMTAGAVNMTVQNIAGTGSFVAQAGDRLSCLGQLRSVTFDVTANQLRRNTQPIIADVVSLQAQYGISSEPRSDQIIRWVNASGVWANPGTASNICDAATANRSCIKAVRVGVVTRNPKLENTAVSVTCSSTNSANPTGICAWAGDATSPAPSLSISAGANWNRYRYRSYDIMIPIRNMRYATPLL